MAPLFQQPLLTFSNPSLNRVVEIPLQVAGLIGWYDADDLSTITKDGSDFVSQWDDKSGEGNHVTQATGTDQPLWVDGAHNSRDTIRFDGTNDWLNVDPFTSGAATQPVSIFIVCTMPSGGSDQVVIDGDTARIIFGRTGTIYRVFAGTELTGTTTTTALRQYRVLANGASSDLRRNESSILSGAAGASSLNGITFGANFVGGEAANCDISEVLVYDANVTGADLALIEQYLQDRWGQP